MKDEGLSILVDRLRRIAERFHRSFLLIAFSFLLLSQWNATVRLSLLSLPPSTVLEPPMLAMEIPADRAEMTALVSPANVQAWRRIVWWDFPFIGGYVLLFTALWLPERRRASRVPRMTVWENVVYCAVATALADIWENVSIFVYLNTIERGARLAQANAFRVLPIAGMAKWILFFLTCRALAHQYRERQWRWRWVGFALRALTTPAMWAAAFSVAGLPGRPVIGLTAFLAASLLVVASMVRYWSQIPEPSSADVAAQIDAAGAVAFSGS